MPQYYGNSLAQKNRAHEGLGHFRNPPKGYFKGSFWGLMKSHRVYKKLKFTERYFSSQNARSLREVWSDRKQKTEN